MEDGPPKNNGTKAFFLSSIKSTWVQNSSNFGVGSSNCQSFTCDTVVTCSETSYFRTTDETNNQPLGVQWISTSDLTCFISAILAAQTANTRRGTSNMVAAKILHAASSWSLFARLVPAPSVEFHKFTPTKAGLHGILVRWVPRIWLNWATRMDSIWHGHSLQKFCMAHLCGLIPAFFNVPRGVRAIRP